MNHLHVAYRLGEDRGEIEMSVSRHDLVTWALLPDDAKIWKVIGEYVELPKGAEILSVRLAG